LYPDLPLTPPTTLPNHQQEYLRHAVYDKEQREYIGWLERVKSFLGAK
jgi:hypothetical protein